MIDMFSEQYIYEDNKPNEIIKSLFETNRFLTLETLQEKHQQQIVKSISLSEFFEECELDPTLPYHKAVARSCRKACMYMLYAIKFNQPSGKSNLKKIRVVEGFVGYTPHSWLLLDDTFIIDLTLSQFSETNIPNISILNVEDVKDLYNPIRSHTWLQWIDLENEQMDIPI